MLTLNPVRFDPENVRDETTAVLNALAAASPVTRTEAFAFVAVAADVFIANPVTEIPVISLATGVMVTAPLDILDPEIIPVPVTFANVTLLVVATACPIDTTAAPALTPDPVIVTPVDPVAVAM
jgi:hypothetical protein